MIDPSQAGQPAAAPQPGATVVCIAPQGDGSFAVYPEGGTPEALAPDMNAALDQARQMLGGAGQDATSVEAQAEELFTGGFNEASGRAPVMG